MDNVTFRPMTKEDCSEVLNFLTAVSGVRLHQTGEDTVDGLCTYLDRNPGFSFVAELDGQIIGTIWCGHDGRRGLIHHLAVGLPYRRQGIGKKLLRLAATQLRDSHIKKSFLFVLKENDIGEAFYRSLFWKEEDGVKIFAKVI